MFARTRPFGVAAWRCQRCSCRAAASSPNPPIVERPQGGWSDSGTNRQDQRWVKWLFNGAGIGLISIPVGLAVEQRRHKEEQRRREEEQRRAEMAVANSTVVHVPPPVYIHRKHYEEQLLDLLDANDHYAVLISGNHMVGKTELVDRVLKDKPGVVQMILSTGGKLAEDQLVQKLGVANIAEAEKGLREAARNLGREPIVVIDVTRNVKDPQVMESVSGFAKAWGYELRLAKVLVMASTAAAALSFDPAGRKHELFVGPLTSEEMESAEVDAFLEEHGGTEARKHKESLYQMTGGNIGRMQELAEKLKKGEWKLVEAGALAALKSDVHRFFTIDTQGGFGPEKVRAARDLARAVAAAPFGVGVDETAFDCFSPKHFAMAVREAGAHPLYYDAARRRYCAASLAAHVALKQACC